MHEIVINLHMHTTYSDGTGTHQEIAQAAIQAGLDAIIVTDHNVWVEGVEGYYGDEDASKVLVLIGEEIHDQIRQPQKNHLLVFGAERELATLASNPQTLVNGVNEAGGLAFLAHPIDPEAPKFNQEDLSWVDWDVTNFTGIELWNSMTEFKSLLTGYLEAIWYSFNFDQVAHGPFPETLNKWDELLANGRPVVAVGGSDAHRLKGSLGPISRPLFPYLNHFRAINTHLMLPQALSGDLVSDKAMIFDALRKGHAFVGYDLPAPTKGFRFTAHCAEQNYSMGDTISALESITLQVKLPQPTEGRLLLDGQEIASTSKRGGLIHKVTQPGVYRFEAYLDYKGKRRGWIFSNPIYVR